VIAQCNSALAVRVVSKVPHSAQGSRVSGS
jgi:hypothetical protein